jgi:ATP-dependent DNA ligase
MPDQKIKARFIEFRALAIKSGGRVYLRSRNDKDFNAKYPVIVQTLTAPQLLVA